MATRVATIGWCLVCAWTAGCASLGRPPPRDLPPGETAVLTRSESGEIVIESIDGEAAKEQLSNQYEVPPGVHTLGVRLDALNAGKTRFYAEAGHRYYLRLEINASTDMWHAWVDDGGLRVSPPPEPVEDLKYNCETRYQRAACVGLAAAYEQGFTAVGWNEAHAATLYAHACNAGEQSGCVGLGNLYETGHGATRNGNDAGYMYEKACNAGYPRGCNRLAILYHQGIGKTRDFVTAEKWYRKACDGGYTIGCYNLGHLYNKTFLTERQRAVPFYEKACAGGEPSGCYQLGTLYQEGSVVAADAPRAALLYNQACQGGDPQGCDSLGQLYEQGDGVPTDGARAASLYDKACTAGLPMGCANLGALHALGLGVDLDEERACALLRRACDGGLVAACTSKSIMELQHQCAPEKPAAAQATRRP